MNLSTTLFVWYHIVSRPPLSTRSGYFAGFLQFGLVRKMDARWRREDEWLDETVENKGSVASICVNIYNNECKDASRRTYTSKAKPTIWRMDSGQTKASQPNPRLTIQIPRVLQVSTVLRVVALTQCVTLRPKKLKDPMENMMAKQDQKTVGVETI